MKKEIEISLKIAQAWKRSVVFMKLVKHKIGNGHLHGEWDRYSFAIIWHYRSTEWKLLSQIWSDDRGGDRKSQEYKENKFREHKKLFDKYIYDDELRAIIARIDKEETPVRKEKVS